MFNKELQALIKLLEDKNSEIFTIVENQLLEKGVDIVPELEKAWEDTQSKRLQSRLENLIHQLQTRELKKRFADWVKNKSDDLLLGAFLLAQYQYPGLNYDDIQNTLKEIKYNFEQVYNQRATPLDKIRALNHVLFQNYKFIQNSSDFFAPENSYINKVLDLKKGNSTSIAILYLTIARSFSLPVYGVNLPRNFIIAYVDEANPEPDGHILFYVNPVNRGAVLGRKEIDYYLKQINMKSQVSYYVACTNIEIIDRLLLNLIDAYGKQKKDDKVSDMEHLLEILRKKRKK